MQKVSIQKLRNSSHLAEPIDVAIKYYSFLSTLHNLKLAKREIQLVAFTAIRGTISSLSAREDFCEKFNSTTNTINNMVSRLYNKQILVKDGSRIKVNPAIALNFSNNIWLQIKLERSPDVDG